MMKSEAFLEHYGVKGMRWGVRKEPERDNIGVRGKGTGGDAKNEKAKMSNRKKIAIGAGVLVGAAALVAVGVAVNSKQSEKGRAVATQQIQAFGKKSKWELATELPSKSKSKAATPTASKPKGRKGREQAAQEHIKAFGKKSKWELAGELATKPKKSSGYSRRDTKKDVKLYGGKGQSRIQKNVNKGMLLSDARKREATRQHGVKAVRVALNVGSAQKQEKKQMQKFQRERVRNSR